MFVFLSFSAYFPSPCMNHYTQEDKIMLKFNRAIVITILFIVFSGCDKNPLTNETERVVYQGIIAENTPAPFLLNSPKGGLRAKGNTPEATILENPAWGTVYGHSDYPGKAYLAQGDEQLPGGAWVDNAYGNEFTFRLHSGGTASFGKGRYIQVLSAYKLNYQNAAGDWNKLTRTGTIFALALAAEESDNETALSRSLGEEDGGSGDIETDDTVNFGGGGQNN